jgi:pyrophosphate--fructose-6-phosphate 1-phosphotransferase
MVEARVAARGGKCATQTHSFGYEGRCGAPTPFDSMLGYNLGLCAASLALDGRTGYMAAFTDFIHGGKALGLPLKGLLFQEHREGKDIYVIRKALVKLDSPAYLRFNSQRAIWAAKDNFCSPGPRQYWGPAAQQMPFTVVYNQGYNTLQFKL